MQPKTGAKHPKSTTFCGPPQGCGLEERSAMPMEVWTGAYRLPRRKGSRVFGVTFRHGSSVMRGKERKLKFRELKFRELKFRDGSSVMRGKERKLNLMDRL